MISILQSETHKQYREACNGIDLCQFSMLTKNQFVDMLEKLELKRGERVLDVGCGVGRIAHEVSLRTGAEVVGIDVSAEMMSAGREDFGNQVTLMEMNYDALDFPEASFDCVYCIDSLYFSEDLEKCVLGVLRMLKQSGRACVFWSEIQRDQDPGVLEVENTRLGTILKRNGFPFRSFCYTDDEREFWKKASQKINELEADFRNEGYGEFVDAIRSESTSTLKYVENGQVSRFMYLIEPVARD